MSSVDKIRVLLIDDAPEGLLRSLEFEGGEYWVPKLGPTASTGWQIESLQELFDIRWLATAEESREFRDLSKVLSLTHPAALGQEGWVPEILCFDYALSSDTRRVDDRLPPGLASQVSPLASLRRCAADRNIFIPPPSSHPASGAATGNDNEGCYCGGLILTLFWAHPCAPVALTRKGDRKTVGTEAGFFEWLLEIDGAGTFKSKGRTTTDWTELLVAGLPNLRRRVEQLIQVRVIEVSLNDLLLLADTGQGEALEIRSRYTVRHLPIAGLFGDLPGQTRVADVQAWARHCLEILFSDLMTPDAEQPSQDPSQRLDKALLDFKEGMSFAGQLWQEYNSERLAERYGLSRLAVAAADRELEPDERRELERLCEVFGIEPGRLHQGPDCKRNYCDLRSGERSGQARRWSALMVMVRLEMLATAARQALRRFNAKNGVDRGFDPLLQELRQEDVYLALFPVPLNPLKTPFEGSGDLSSSSLRHTLKSLTGVKKGDLALDIKDVLAGKDWRLDPAKGRCGPCGLRPGERYLLRLYAATLDLFQQEWLREVRWLQESRSEEQRDKETA